MLILCLKRNTNRRKNKKQKTVKKGEVAYVIITNLIADNSLGAVGNIIPDNNLQCRIASSFKEAKKLVIEQAKLFETADSEFAIQPLIDDFDSRYKLHAIVHVYYDEHFKPCAEADDTDGTGLGWVSITFDVCKLTVE